LPTSRSTRPRRLAGSERCLIIPSENRAREFDAKLLLGCVAAEAGFKVIVGSRQAIHFWIDRLPRSIYLAKDLRVSSARMFNILDRLGHVIVAWDEEALVYHSRAHYLAARLHTPTLQMTRALFAWGEDNAELWRSSPGYHGAPIHKAGNPRLDLLREDVRPCFTNEVARLKLAYGDFVLVNSNFASVNHFSPNGAEVIRARIACSRARAFHDQAFAYRSTLLRRFLDMVPQLARTFPQATIVVRPHPSESEDVWRRCAAGLGNVVIQHEGSIVPWLMAAKAVVHNGCTTAIEASILGKGPIAYRPTASAEFDIHRPNEISATARTMEELCDAVAESWGTAGGSPHPRMADYVAPPGNNLYSERIVDAIEQMIDQGRLDTEVGRCGRTLGHIKAMVRRHGKARQRDTSQQTARYDAHRFQSMTADETEAAIRRLSRTLHRFEGVKVAQIKPDVFRLTA